MTNSNRIFDYIVIGAGIVGLTLARELARAHRAKILVLEKEADVGRHASGRNSGVVHAGIYYAADSLKAKFCVEGHRRLIAYAEEQGIPLLKCGKVIVAHRPENVGTLQVLLDRAAANGVKAERISLDDLREIEPNAFSHEYALWSPQTAVIDSRAVLEKLRAELVTLGVTIAFGEDELSFDPAAREVRSPGGIYKYGFLYNTAGAYADRVAHAFGVGLEYRLMPFKGLYWKATPDFASKVRTLIYPAPDVRMPFLGIHITRTIDGNVLLGPTAIPAFGRENYSLLGNLDARDTPSIAWNLGKMMIKNQDGIRRYVREEMGRYLPSRFFAEAAAMSHTLRREHVGAFYKVGIRAQLMNTQTGRLEMDFKLAPGPHSLHVLNAVSPAFTCAFAFAAHIVGDEREHRPVDARIPDQTFA